MKLESISMYSEDGTRCVCALGKISGRVVVIDTRDDGEEIHATVDILDGSGPDIGFRFDFVLRWAIPAEVRAKIDACAGILEHDIYNTIIELSDSFMEV